MSRVRQSGTTPELVVRHLLTDIGARYRLNVKSLPGSPDIANKRAGVAIFVHGCFWHRHPGCAKTTTPNRNEGFWRDKFRANQARDRTKAEQLRRRGFRVLIVWECETEEPVRLCARLRRFWERGGGSCNAVRPG